MQEKEEVEVVAQLRSHSLPQLSDLAAGSASPGKAKDDSALSAAAQQLPQATDQVAAMHSFSSSLERSMKSLCRSLSVPWLPDTLSFYNIPAWKEDKWLIL